MLLLLLAGPTVWVCCVKFSLNFYDFRTEVVLELNSGWMVVVATAAVNGLSRAFRYVVCCPVNIWKSGAIISFNKIYTYTPAQLLQSFGFIRRRVFGGLGLGGGCGVILGQTPLLLQIQSWLL